MTKKNFYSIMFIAMTMAMMNFVFTSCSSDDDEEGGSGVNGSSPAEAVDLGLPSGTLWASCNVGATKPEEYGDYFAWGETKPKEECSWDNYKWGNGRDKNHNKMTKYNTNDNKKELDLEDDVAHVYWGGLWRTPSLDQIKELIDNCNCVWTTVNGVKGCKVTSKKNGTSIFLPAAGLIYDKSFKDEGSYGLYWSRTISPYIWAWNFYFHSSDADFDDGARCYGKPIRPVRMK